MASGPRIDVENHPGLAVEVSRAYGGERRAPQLWSGMLSIFHIHQPLMEIEVQLVQGNKGTFVSLPQRMYGDDNNRKYKKMVFVNEQSLLSAMKEAIEAYEKAPPTPDEDDRPF
jgi:DNA-binding cell septation regulator SpoVG